MSILEYFSSILKADTISKLKERNIRSVIDFLAESPESISHITNLHFKDVLEIRKNLINSVRRKPLTALELYKEVDCHHYVISSGISELDQSIGNLECGHIYEICGMSGSGKTQLCSSIAAHAASEGNRVHFIDTKNDFSASRIFQMLSKKEKKEKNIMDAMERVKVTKAFNLQALIDVLYWLKTLFSIEHTSLIIIDCVSTCYFSCVGSDKPIGFALLNHVASLMKCIVKKHHSIIVTTNLATKYFGQLDNDSRLEKPVKPCMGSYWQQVSNIRLDVRKENNAVSYLHVEKSDKCIKNKCCRIDLSRI